MAELLRAVAFAPTIFFQFFFLDLQYFFQLTELNPPTVDNSTLQKWKLPNGLTQKRSPTIYILKDSHNCICLEQKDLDFLSDSRALFAF